MYRLAEAYIEARFSSHSEQYKDKWRQRFADGTEWERSDFEGRRCLQLLAPRLYPDNVETVDVDA